METEKEAIQLDRDIKFAKPQESKKRKKVSRPVALGATGLAIVIAMLFIKTEQTDFVESMPPEEQAERETIHAAAVEVSVYQRLNDSLPGQENLTLPPGIFYEKEDDISWSLESETGLYYSSDMDVEAFRSGEI